MIIQSELPADKNWILDKMYFYADKYEVSAEEVYQVIQCETSNTFDTDIQSGYKYPNGQ